ncbi:hypothetical protein V7S43_009750 [Phytophthora oleae]|uniref:Uncharacterized protein n=1 Tax=Phytophthora oleae TaxID=2107226 RepID=A0ABD3FDU1_9STRA
MKAMALTVVPVFQLCLAIAAAESVSGHWVYNFNRSQLCINMGIFDNKVSSAQWKDLPQTDQARIAFYRDENCDGLVRTWPAVDTNFPSNFALYGLNKQISSFMLWEGSDQIVDIAPDPRFLE